MVYPSIHSITMFISFSSAFGFLHYAPQSSNKFAVSRHLKHQSNEFSSKLYVSESSSSPPPDNWEREWNIPESRAPTCENRRQERLQNEAENRDRFYQGKTLFELRESVNNLKKKLQVAVKERDVQSAQDLTSLIDEMQQRDAEHIYAESSKRLEKAKRGGDREKILHLNQEMKNARSSIPHFNLEGLWVGKYGAHGYEMINVTYIGDTLIAYKVTGDKNVPKGEITFQADLSPLSEIALEPITLTSPASKRWGIEHLVRFPGKGQVASEGFRNAQWMEGQLIMVGDYFSFAWIPISHQIFFGRPSPDLTLEMLTSSGSVNSDANVDDMKDFAMRCLEETAVMQEEEECPLHHNALGFYYENQDGCFE